MPGYLAIHLLGLSSGILILPPTPSFFRRQQQAEKRPKKADHTVPLSSPRENDKTAVELFSYTAIWWTLLGLTNLIGVGGGVSRRMVCH
jgi:glucosaminylphosphatidylinositol acyltransferase